MILVHPFSAGPVVNDGIRLVTGMNDAELREYTALRFQGFKAIQVRDPRLPRSTIVRVIFEWRNMADMLIEEEGPKHEGRIHNELISLQRRLIAEAEKLKILVQKSRTLFGVAEPPRFSPTTGDRLPGNWVS